LSRETAIMAKAIEEVTTIAMISAATWRVGSVLIAEVYFMSGACIEGGNSITNCEECAGKMHLCERRKPGTMPPTKVTATGSPLFLVVGKNLVVRK
jgi:hypothetical protein